MREVYNSLRKDGSVTVTNKCKRGTDDTWDQAQGLAKPVEGSNNARLQVSFFRPFWGDYWVIALDPDYRWAMVGHPDKKYLWILSRTPEMAPGIYKKLVAQANSLGYHIESLKKTDQSCVR